MELDTASTRIWLPMERRATLSDWTSGTPAPSSVPSMRQKRAMANCATNGPTSGERRTKPSQTRRPFSETTHARAMKCPTTTSAIATQIP